MRDLARRSDEGGNLQGAGAVRSELTMIAVATNTVSLERRDGILVATIDNPPVNALSHSARIGLLDALAQFEGDHAARALVIACAGRTFIAGADIREFNRPMQAPRLGEVIEQLDLCKKPVIAAMHGTALGGGLEVALACHYRIATESARFGLPEVKLGLLPGAGGCVRLPRLIGAEAALRMISEGGQIGAAEARERGLIDEIVPGDLLDSALAFARKIVANGANVRRTSALPAPTLADGFLDGKRAEIAKKQKGFRAPLVAVDLIEMMAVTPFAEAVAREQETCRNLVAQPESKALRHLFAAERATLKIDGVDESVRPRAVGKVAIIGPGTMGRGIAQCFLDAGIPVILIGRSAESLNKAVVGIRRSYESAVKRGAMTSDDADRRMALLTATRDFAGFDDVDLAIETASEDLETKKKILRHLETALRRDAIIATNTSFLDIEALASTIATPDRFAGMHFFNPANVMKLLENVRVKATAPGVLATISALGKRLGKTPVMVGPSEGFVANRMLSKRSREAQFLLEDGAAPQQVDRVLTGFGFPIGPFALADLAGLDVMAAARAARKGGMTDREKACDIVEKLATAGRLGQKSGAGYYRYGEDRKRQPDAYVDELLAAHRSERGIQKRDISDGEILERCLYAMVNEAAKILDEGGAARASDIDVIWTKGFGWPTYLGGPMFWADQIGLPKIKAALERYSGGVGAQYFQPATLIERRVAEGRGFLD